MALRHLLLNEVDPASSSVRMCLESLVRMHPSVLLHQKHNIVFRSDMSHLKGKVVIIGGGGSGHEPADAGLVGPGLLSAAVCGAVFASPPPEAILAAIYTIMEVTTPSGILLAVKNYTGDRLNFGLALERARSYLSTCPIDMVTVGEDVAVEPPSRAGRRGLAGCVLAWKIAGAMSEEERSLADIVGTINSLNNRMATLTMMLWPGAPPAPGSPPSTGNFMEGEVELGRGIHGESGTMSLKVTNATGAVKCLLDILLNRSGDQVLPRNPGNELAVLVNNLGGLSVLEIGVIATEVYEYCQRLKIPTGPFFQGTVVTSLAAPGFSVTLMRGNFHMQQWLKATCGAPGWPSIMDCKVAFSDKALASSSACTPYTKKLIDQSVKGHKFPAELIEKVLHKVADSLINSEQELNHLDVGVGDGDCGSTFRRGAEALKATISHRPVEELESPSLVLSMLANVAEESMGGTSGALYAIALVAAVNSVDWTNDQVRLQCLCMQSFRAAIRGVQKHGQAKIGDRTMIDALLPAYNAMKEVHSKDSKINITNIFKIGVETAEAGCENTCQMIAQAGRASYVSAVEAPGPDPGAFAVVIWMRAVYEALVAYEAETSLPIASSCDSVFCKDTDLD